jgi:hypothetical protein
MKWGRPSGFKEHTKKSTTWIVRVLEGKERGKGTPAYLKK